MLRFANTKIDEIVCKYIFSLESSLEGEEVMFIVRCEKLTDWQIDITMQHYSTYYIV